MRYTIGHQWPNKTGEADDRVCCEPSTAIRRECTSSRSAAARSETGKETPHLSAAVPPKSERSWGATVRVSNLEQAHRLATPLK